MFDFAFSELMVIALIALIVVGPQRLPRLARTAGHWLGRVQRYVSDVKGDIEREMQLEDLKKLQQEVEQEARELQQSVRKQASDFEREMRGTAAAVEADLNRLGTTAAATSPEAATSEPAPPAPVAAPVETREANATPPAGQGSKAP